MIHVSGLKVFEAPSCGISSFVGGWAVDSVAVDHADCQEPYPDTEDGQDEHETTTRRRNPGAAAALLCGDFWMAMQVKIVGSAEPLWR